MGNMPNFARFWMICAKPTRPHHKTEPTRRYSTLADARHAAEQMAARHDRQFLILETVATVHPSDASFGGLDL